jgi:hypothetical protein
MKIKANTNVAASPQFSAEQIRTSLARRRFPQGKYRRRWLAAIFGRANTSAAGSPPFSARQILSTFNVQSEKSITFVV